MKPKDRSGFDVAIICALDFEMTAVNALFTKRWTGYGKQALDPNIYTTGMIDGRNIVLAHMPGNGTARAAAAAVALRLSFPGIKIALVVGVCSIVPFALGKELMLGDVIISDELIQYDFGNIRSDRFEVKNKVRDSLPRLGPELKALLSKISIPMNLRDLQRKTLNILPKVQRKCGEYYNHPGLEYDTLFHAGYRHKHNPTLENSVCRICEDCGTSNEPVCSVAEASSCQELGCQGFHVPRERSSHPMEYKPEILIGKVASGSAAMRSGERRDMAAEQLEVIAFDMGGAGVWDIFPCLVIKGGCDYADSHKSDLFQRYAAATAAACARAFLEQWEEDTSQVSSNNTQVSQNTIRQIFETPRARFKNNLAEAKFPKNLYRAIVTIETKGQMLSALEKLQEKQKSHGDWRHLGRISPLLDRLEDYAHTVIEFLNLESETMAVIWGSMHVLLLWSSEHGDAYDSVIKAVMRIGKQLPEFSEVVTIFSRDKLSVATFLALFYGEMLDFFLMALKFFSEPAWKGLFGAVWESQQQIEKLRRIEENIAMYARLLSDKTSVVEIEQARMGANQASSSSKQQGQKEVDQLFSTLEVKLRRRIYEDKLEQLRTRVQERTGEWLLKDQTFHGWLNVGKQWPKHLWLKGIPGAGKTYLSYWAINHLQTATSFKTAYLFITYADAENTALSMIHSLLFQISTDNEYLQLVLVEKQDWKNNATMASEFLKTAAMVVGPLFIIIDGLDEADSHERRVFLELLTQVSAACAQVKVCIASRPDPDIGRLFKAGAESILVNERNHESIKAYVRSRYDDWMAKSTFGRQSQSEIERFLSTIVIRSNGMFLYARVVIDNVESLDSVEEIKDELKALPEQLDDAYARILNRINADKTQGREKALRILGWMQCAPVPMTVYEMEQALLKTPGISVVENRPDIVKLCGGALVEIVDERPQFVHFTAKEYIAHSTIQGHIDPARSTFNLLDTCIRYLSSRPFELQLTKAEIDENIGLGHYRLANFATSQWFSLLNRYMAYAGDARDIQELAGVLQPFAQARHNPRCEANISEIRKLPYVFKRWRHLYDFLCRMLAFQADDGRLTWTVTAGSDWAKYDPSTLSNTMIRIERQYVGLIRQARREAGSRLLDDLERHHGTRLYRCYYLDCPRRLEGFIQKGDCDEHIESHNRSFKCSVPDCRDADGEFLCESQLQKHNVRFHKQTPVVRVALPELEHLHPYLFQLVEKNDVDELEALWPSCRMDVDITLCNELVTRAAELGNLPIVQLLLGYRTQDSGERYAHPKYNEGTLGRRNIWAICSLSATHANAAFRSNNKDLIKWMLGVMTEQYDGWEYGDVVAAVLESKSWEILHIWEKIVLDVEPKLTPSILNAMISRPALRKAKSTKLELELLKIWKRFERMGRLDSRFWSRALVNVGQYSRSIKLAKGLLKSGADVNFRLGKRLKKTSLHHSLKSTSKIAAEYAQFLLEQGADPWGVDRTRGARKISEQLGMTWYELVEKSRSRKLGTERKRRRHV